MLWGKSCARHFSSALNSLQMTTLHSRCQLSPFIGCWTEAKAGKVGPQWIFWVLVGITCVLTLSHHEQFWSYGQDGPLHAFTRHPAVSSLKRDQFWPTPLDLSAFIRNIGTNEKMCGTNRKPPPKSNFSFEVGTATEFHAENIGVRPLCESNDRQPHQHHTCLSVLSIFAWLIPVWEPYYPLVN